MIFLGGAVRVILICAGDASRWGGYLGYPKHLIPVMGERLIDRTIRLLHEITPDVEVLIAARPDLLDEYTVPGALTVPADLDVRNHDADKFLSSRTYWCADGDTILLYGDVFFTRAAIASILGTAVDDWALFARFRPSDITGGQWPECWAFRLTADFQDDFKAVARYLIGEYDAGRIDRIGGWEFYAVLAGGDLETPGVQLANGVEVDDWTEDFDYPSDFTRWCERAVIHGYKGQA